MIRLKNIVSDSAIVLCGTLQENKNIHKYANYIKYNSSWLNEFNNIFFSLNGSDNVIQTFRDYHPDKTILYDETLPDNDSKAYKYFKDKPYEYIWRFSLDVLADQSLFELEVDEHYDFFYLNEISLVELENINEEDLLENIMSQKYFCPHTTYYIYRNKLKKWHNEIKTTSSILGNTIDENNFKKYNLSNKEDTSKLLGLIKKHKIKNPQHINILYTNIGNLCNYKIMNSMVVEI